MAPRKHAECIIEWANGAEIQRWNKIGEVWVDDPNPLWAQDCKYRVKPAAPAYPETTMTWDDMIEAIDKVGPRGGITISEHQFRAAANAALRHAINAGQVAPAEAYDQCRADLLAAERKLLECRAQNDKISAALAEAERRLERADEREQDVAKNVLESCRLVCACYGVGALRALDTVTLQACIASVK